MRKRVYFISLFLLFFAGGLVRAEETDFVLRSSSDNYSTCPALWSEVVSSSIGTIKKGQVLYSNNIIKSVEAEEYLIYHLSSLWYTGRYNVNYYIVTKDENGNENYEKYVPQNNSCDYFDPTYKQYNHKFLSADIIDTAMDYHYDINRYEDGVYLILPTVNGKSVKWRYESETDKIFDEENIDYIIDNGDFSELSTLQDYFNKLKEKNVSKIKIANSKEGYFDPKHNYTYGDINFYEVTDEETNYSITCNNSSVNKYDCSLSLKYDFIPNNIKVKISSNEIKLNNFIVDEKWSLTEENDAQILEYTNLKNEYEFVDGKEIATFSFEYSGDDPQEYIEKNISVKSIKLINSVGTFDEETIINSLTQVAKKNIFDTNIITTIKEVLNPKTGTGTYILLIWVIISLIMLAMILNKKRVKKFVKTN